MRIVAGEFKGRVIDAPKGHDTRPTGDRVRESMMSAVSSRLGGFSGETVLDLATPAPSKKTDAGAPKTAK